MEAYSLDLRKRVLAAVDEGKLLRMDIARVFSVSTAWIRKLVHQRRQTGSIAPLPRRSGPKPKLDDSHKQILRELVRENPDATLAELREQLPVKVGLVTIWRELDKLQMTLKKSR